VRAVLAGSLLFAGIAVGSVFVDSLPAYAAAVVQTTGVGSEPYAVSSDGTHVWVANEDGSSVTELNASNGSVVQTIGVGGVPESVSSDGTHVWAANTGSNTVTELDASTGAVVQTIGVGSYPYSVSSDGTHVWVANEDDNTVTELNASTGAVVQTIGVGSSPYGVSSDGAHVWVANLGGNTVSEIAINFAIVVPSLTPATPGLAYGPLTLQAANLGVSASLYVTTIKWTGAELPKGLKLSSAGMLSGTPNKKLVPGAYSVVAQVTETVTTLNGKKKVKTPTTVQATIPLTIT
jgi:YVTN family beta-propeller protein